MSNETQRNAVVNLWNEHGWDLDEGMLAHVFTNVVLRHILQAVSIDIYPQEREPAELPPGKKFHSNPPGWIEWIINIKYREGGALTIGAIQREIGGEYELHS